MPHKSDYKDTPEEEKRKPGESKRDYIKRVHGGKQPKGFVPPPMPRGYNIELADQHPGHPDQKVHGGGGDGGDKPSGTGKRFGDVQAPAREPDVSSGVRGTRIRKGDIQRGDVVLDAVGRPLFTVDSVHPAQAKGYVVIRGTGHGHLKGKTQYPIGHREGDIEVLRQIAPR